MSEEAERPAGEPVGSARLEVVPDHRLAGFYGKLRGEIIRWAGSRRGRQNKWLEYLLAAPDLFHLLCALMVEREVPVRDKARLTLVIGYFLSPLDFLPEAVLGPVGYLDDIGLAAFFLHQLTNRIDPELVRRHWAGGGDVLALLQQIIAVADEMVGSGLWRRIRRALADEPSKP
jgi:uncharacterized membrane protein YkvA (DUF1232 family)